MPEPAEILAQEAAAALTAPPAAPGVVDAATGAPVAPAGPPPGRVRAWFGRLWRKLNDPTAHTPEEYRGRRVARMVNESLDGKGAQGAAYKATLGESVALVIDHAMMARGGASTPLGHLWGSSCEYVWIRWDEAPPPSEDQDEPEAPAAPPEPPQPPAVRRAPKKPAGRRRAA